MSIDIASRINSALASITEVCERVGRRDDIELELAIKTRSIAECEAAAHALRNAQRPIIFGQNRVQEAEVTTPALRELGFSDFRATMIGPLQRNKINKVLRVVDEIETVDSIRLAEAINQRVAPNRILDVLIQVNTSGEETKSGISPAEALEFAQQVARMERMRVTGFMTIGAHTPDEAVVRDSFARLRDIRDAAVSLPGLEDASTLSMGMSGDYPLAIAEGATRIRLGSTIFGPRASSA
ncbi:MAG: YggS family pyridoxal phosphate-dependent enzyme [Actinomycetaceae bacterium]|nr:YggS family pyridoxal phosphate-dependent enzyme [Actinomycetaceae bacterium]